MKVKVKKLHPNAVIPTYATNGSAGMDLTATRMEIDNDGNLVAHTDLAFEIPKGYVGLLFPRSSISKKDISLANSVGVLDSDYRGEVTFKFKSHFKFVNPLKFWWEVIVRNKDVVSFLCYNQWRHVYGVGDRVGQIVIVQHPEIEFIESDDLSETERGAGGYGSTGR
jgi:dUTP pyrophosphatase